MLFKFELQQEGKSRSASASGQVSSYLYNSQVILIILKGFNFTATLIPSKDKSKVKDGQSKVREVLHNRTTYSSVTFAEG